MIEVGNILIPLDSRNLYYPRYFKVIEADAQYLTIIRPDDTIVMIRNFEDAIRSTMQVTTTNKLRTQKLQRILKTEHP